MNNNKGTLKLIQVCYVDIGYPLFVCAEFGLEDERMPHTNTPHVMQRT